MCWLNYCAVVGGKINAIHYSVQKGIKNHLTEGLMIMLIMKMEGVREYKRYMKKKILSSYTDR